VNDTVTKVMIGTFTAALIALIAATQSISTNIAVNTALLTQHTGGHEEIEETITKNSYRIRSLEVDVAVLKSADE
jgi:hypothetical protein